MSGAGQGAGNDSFPMGMPGAGEWGCDALPVRRHDVQRDGEVDRDSLIGLIGRTLIEPMIF